MFLIFGVMSIFFIAFIFFYLGLVSIFVTKIGSIIGILGVYLLMCWFALQLASGSAFFIGLITIVFLYIIFRSC